MLGIEYPIILAGMGVTAGPTLAAAVSNAGGLGVMGVLNLEPEEIREWIRRIKTLTDKPFGVNTVLPMGMPAGINAETLRAMIPQEVKAFAEKLAAEWGVPAASEGPPGLELTDDVRRKQLEVILEERVPVLASGMGDPSEYVNEAHARGMKVVAVCGNVKQARRIAEGGTDIIVAQGYDGGGHTGKIGTMALIPQVVDAVRPTPVVAAGGIGDGRGLVAALALGAVGVWMGTAFCATHEAAADTIDMARISPEEIDFWKQKLVEASDSDVILTRVITGKPMHVVRNKFVETWEKEGPACLFMPLQSMAIDELTRGIREARMTELTCATLSGQAVGLVKEITPAEEVLNNALDGAATVMEDMFQRTVNAGG